MNRTKIDWRNPKERWKLDYTLNPIVGCRHACPYCYAKRLNDRFKWIPEWTEPVFYPDRLKELYKIKKPSTIFLGSMSDMFGEWIDVFWILKIFRIITELSQHRFMFLTKNPEAYGHFYFPLNCWFGTTLEHQKYNKRIKHLKMSSKRYRGNNATFVSVEPLLSNMSKVDFSGIDLVIVGAETGASAKPPKKEWIKSIKHDNIFFKPNIHQYL